MNAGTEIRPWPPHCDGGNGFYSVQDQKSGQTTLYPLPLAENETTVSERPPASKHLSLHPGGAVKLYGDAQSLAEQSNAVPSSEGEIAYFERQLWRLCSITFVPGDSVRSGYDRLAKACEIPSSGRRHKPTMQEIREDGLYLLAAHFIGAALKDEGS
ncbi:MAG TPA: hypothetical protein PKD76_12445 [Solirubrobacterales bacterium]|mgnify:CR=1 FL=1|nr:hypothetical protein [Solirubrobacterales bacterium]